MYVNTAIMPIIFQRKGTSIMQESVNLSEREHFTIMCQVFEDVISQEEFKSEQVRQALTIFSNLAHKKIFSSKKERQKVSARVANVVSEVLSGR